MSELKFIDNILKDMKNDDARNLIKSSIANDVDVNDVIISLRSAIVVSSLTTGYSSDDKDKAIAIEALSRESNCDKSLLEDLNTAISYIDNNYKL